MKDLVLKGLRITVVSLALSGCNTPDIFIWTLPNL